MILRRPWAFLFFSMTAATAVSCADVECKPNTRKCEKNVFYWCYHYEWLITPCEGTAPYCDSKKGCLPSPDNVGPSDGGGGEDASSTCSDDEQTCIGNNLYKCMDSTWRIITCPEELPVCDEEQGCIAAP